MSQANIDTLTGERPLKPRYWVTMTDRFMSGWGLASNKTNKLIFECADYSEACIVEANAKARSEMKYVNICTTKPRYNGSSVLAQTKTKDEYPSWYESGYFAMRAAEQAKREHEAFKNGGAA